MPSLVAFTDIVTIVEETGERYGAFQDEQCRSMKSLLFSQEDTGAGGAGRIRLSDFYGLYLMNRENQFTESISQLRKLGALDESSSWRGKQVIVSNYLQGANNCIVSTPHYLVCCAQECEEILNEIETAAGSPFALPSEILPVVLNMTGMTDQQPKIAKTLRNQLDRISETHSGQVPLHGRLFAQWLHYAFPRECPFPHKTGTAAVKTPTQFGDASIASREEVNTHASVRGVNSSHEIEYSEAQSMSQWSEEEELMTDYQFKPGMRWGKNSAFLLVCGILLLPFIVPGATKYECPKKICFMEREPKSHLV